MMKVIRGLWWGLYPLAFALMLASCASVHQEDLDAWQGAPVAALDVHPIFLTFPVIRTKTDDGTEIRRYVNGRNIASCSGGGSAFANSVDMATFSSFSNCMQAFAACNSIFYIKDGHVQRVTLVGTGGMRCYSNETLRPDFRGSTNIR
jgi:hypothetical protein